MFFQMKQMLWQALYDKFYHARDSWNTNNTKVKFACYQQTSPVLLLK